MKECKHRWEQAWPGSYQCNKCNDYAHVEQPKLTVPNDTVYTFGDIIPNYSLTFHNKDHKKVGSFDFNEGVMNFEGDVTESGQIFVDWVVNAFKQRLDDAVRAERKKCIDRLMKLHEEANGAHNTFHFAANELMKDGA
jgi:hypothetical protein